MRQILDLHLHSRFSRACSPQLTVENLGLAAQRKGVDILGTADFTHPAWFKELVANLEEINTTGLYRLKFKPEVKTKFIFSTEVALVYKDGGQARRIHLVVQAPNLEAVRELNQRLAASYNIRSDGRPILGISAPKFCELCFSINQDFLIYPAHIWTPWYAVFGSKSGFNSLSECFHEYTDRIYAIETGLSSDPEMNWRLSALDKLTILSNSDAHSLDNIGREANIMEFADDSLITYRQIYDNIKKRTNLKATIEFYPEEGRYHLDGHRDCNFSCQPAESRRLKNICPVCGRPLTIGVLNRVEELADRPSGFKPEGAVPFIKLIELDKIIADSLGIKSRQSLAVKKIYDRLLKQLGSELNILLECDVNAIAAVAGNEIAAGIGRARIGDLTIKPGFDGQYGEVQLFPDKDKQRAAKLL
jgi:uncharacterized protein (TIGR00375 family)